VADDASTCWTLIRGAASGVAADREAFARRYEVVVRASLCARWRGTPRIQDVEDAVQDVFAECFRPEGPLVRADPARSGGFRGFLFGVTRNIARRVEEAGRRRLDDARGGRADDLDEDLPARDASLATTFEKAWASALLREAASEQTRRAADVGDAALRRVELLRLRFHDGLPIRDIAARWEVEPTWLHHQFATARDEFRRALTVVVRAQFGGSDEDVERECLRLVAALGSG
jgi:RNA polymerase sigma-70 factor (ECF subfamily)